MSEAIEAAPAALRRAAEKSMDKGTIRDKIEEGIRRDNYMKVQEFGRRLEMLHFRNKSIQHFKWSHRSEVRQHQKKKKKECDRGGGAWS